MSSASNAPPSPGPRRTLRLGAGDAAPLGESAASTDYTLAAAPRFSLAPPGAAVPRGGRLDPAQRTLFHRRLALCCLIALVPFAFLLLCSATNFIQLLGRNTVGWTGVALASLTLAALAACAGYLVWAPPLSEQTLRVLEIAVFGLMAVFFAYWHFALLTASPFDAGFERAGLAAGAPPGPAGEPLRDQLAQTTVLAAAALIHINWFVLIVFHGVLVPNTLWRGVGITLGMVAAAILISIVASAVHPPTRQNALPLFAISVTLLGAASGLSIFGTAKTEALRREVQTALEAVRELGQYRLKRKLGQGGMGEVYLAEHHLLKRPCAIKRIHPRYLNNPEQIRRFEREVQATVQLMHPNTVKIYDYGRADDGTFYYVMEYLPGLSLEDLVLRFGPQHPARVVHLMRQICGALNEAHRHGLVHRDIKPSNVVVFPDGSPHDQVKVLDFGLVHSLSDEIEPDSKITREGLIVGTPEYMSPEQASGMALDGRSDLFSLGSVAYFLLTAREVFHRDNPMKTLLAVVNEPPPPVVNFAPDTPDDVRRVLKRCLAKSPSERFGGAAELAEALSQCACAADWTAHRANDWWATHADATPDFGTDLSTLPLAEVEVPPGPTRRLRK